MAIHGENRNNTAEEAWRTDDTAAILDMKWQRRSDAGATNALLACVTASGAVDLWALPDEGELGMRRTSQCHVVDNQLALSLDWNDGVARRFVWQ